MIGERAEVLWVRVVSSMRDDWRRRTQDHRSSLQVSRLRLCLFEDLKQVGSGPK